MDLPLPIPLSATLPLFGPPADAPSRPAAGVARPGGPAGAAGAVLPRAGADVGAAEEAPDACRTSPAALDEIAHRWLDPAALPPLHPSARPAMPAVPAPDPETLHPSLWRASQVGAGVARTTPSGFAALDAQLPGGGWPHGVLTELLLPQPGIGELRLLAPALAAAAGAASSPALMAGPGAGAARVGSGTGTGRGAQDGIGGGGSAGRGRAAGMTAGEGTEACVMLFDPPARLSAWALAQQGLDARRWVVVQPRAPARHPRGANGLAPLLPGADLLWALEQALRSGHLGVALAWLPLVLRTDALRRLQLAAQAHDGPVFVFRDAEARSRPSPAPLRLLLQPAGIDGLALRLLKRRGPPVAEVLRLQLPPVLGPRQQARAEARQALQQAGRPAGAGASRPGNRMLLPSGRSGQSGR